jgi:hypothetical protein
MDDTTTDVKRYVRERYARMTMAERAVIGAQLFESARTLVLASFPPDLSEAERRRRLCERYYGRELAERAFPRP